jgi:hypothetical protein
MNYYLTLFKVNFSVIVDYKTNKTKVQMNRYGSFGCTSCFFVIHYTTTNVLITTSSKHDSIIAVQSTYYLLISINDNNNIILCHGTTNIVQ